MACDKAGIKYLHGVECYLTEKHLHYEPQPDGEIKQVKVRDNFHTILIARNFDGVKEINEVVSRSTEESHFYYKPRLSFDEFLGLSQNVIKISACLASPLNKLSVCHKMYERLSKHYDYYEIQPHLAQEQIAYNRHLAELSKKNGVPLIAGTDTHSLSQYKAECRGILLESKRIGYADEDKFDLTYKSYDELVEMFREQDAIPEKLWMEAIENTNRMADSVEDFDLDLSFKYPELYGERDEEVLWDTIWKNFQAKIDDRAILPEHIEPFKKAIEEEMRVFGKINMHGFMLFMSELVTWCKENGIPVGFNRGSCGGSRVAYVTNTTDLNPEVWNTVFSRFANEDRKEIGDIDIDVSPSDRDRVYEYIINRFGQEKSAFILAIGTIKDKGCIDEIGRALSFRWEKKNLINEKEIRAEIAELRKNEACCPKEKIEQLNLELAYAKEFNEAKMRENPYSLNVIASIKKEYESNPESAREKYPEIFYYFDGLIGTAISQSMHPAGIVASPVTLPDNYGVFVSEGKTILQIDMECVHEVSLVKYDILGLKNIEIIKDAYELIGDAYPKAHEIDWYDEAVWKDMLRSPVGIFQFEGAFAFEMLRKYIPHSIFDMSLVTAALRPSGASYRDDLMAHKPHTNPSPIIDELLEANHGYLIYQEDVIKFLQQICGFSGSDADNTRRAIGRKDEERLKKALPKILEGYCNKSPQSRDVAEAEAKEFLQIIEDASSYMFGYNHSVGYCMIGYLCAYLRYYHPYEFITAYLNNANGEEDIKSGSELASLYGVKIVPPKFGVSKDRYMFDKGRGVIAKGMTSIKYLNPKVANELFDLSAQGRPETFMDLLCQMFTTSIDTRQRDILIKVDFFSEYGNARELMRILDFFNFFRTGNNWRKTIPKDKLDEQMSEIVEKYATGLTKAGKPSKSYTLLDIPGLLNECEQVVRKMRIQDFDYKVKMQQQLEMLGYIDLTTGKESDRKKLLVTEIYQLCSKDSGECWGYAVHTRSIGSGKTSRLTVRARTFDKEPVRKGDIIYANAVSKNRAGYWYLDSYHKLA